MRAGQRPGTALAEAIEILVSDRARGRQGAGRYLDRLVERYPDLAPIYEDRWKGQVIGQAAHAAGSLISPGDQACWTLVGT